MLLNIALFETAPSYISTTIPETFICFLTFRTRFWKCWVRWFNDFSCNAYVYSNSCFEANSQFLEQGNVCCRETRTYKVYGDTGVLFSARNFYLGRDVKQPAIFRSFLSASRRLLEGTRSVLDSPCDLYERTRLHQTLTVEENNKHGLPIRSALLLFFSNLWNDFDFHCEDLCCISTQFSPNKKW